ncbi:Alpha-2C adrenergic receptor [Clarias magur]|uniref:Alpha-2C adrenergic receptor n=1 Tax=Clarias magur TaxID=1594786 RepID=A0A8J4UIW4_CLAMG|nr:Alpha-2C adrenergic receptor [Clarias magur]
MDSKHGFKDRKKEKRIGSKCSHQKRLSDTGREEQSERERQPQKDDMTVRFEDVVERENMNRENGECEQAAVKIIGRMPFVVDSEQKGRVVHELGEY